MNNSKLYKVLQTLNSKQLNRFKKFVQSPYFNVNESLSKLFDYLHSCLKENSESKEDAAWNYIFPGQKLDGQKFRKAQSDLLSLVEDFLVQEMLQDEPLVQHNFLLQAIKKYKVEILQNKVVTNSSKEAKRREQQSPDYFIQRFLIDRNQYKLTSQYEQKARKKNMTAALELQELTGKLDMFYLMEKMRHGSDLLYWGKMYKTEFDLAPFEFTAKLIERSNYLDVPGVGVFYNIYKSFVDQDNTKYYYDLKKRFANERTLFPEDLQSEIYNSMVNYCIGRINKGFLDFIPEALELYVQGIDSGLTLVDGEFSPTDFRNIVGLALRYNYIDFAFEFLENNIHLVNPKFRNNAKNFNLARIYFYKKEHEKVLDHLNEVDFEDVWYNINSKAMLTATYFETEEWTALESLLGSFNAFIRREKSLTENRRKPYLNFIKLVRKMIKLHPITEEKIEKLKEEIQNTPSINKNWLLEQVKSKVNAK